MTVSKVDVIVLGGGPGGVSAAGYLAQKGHSVTLIEKVNFPRFKIGESLLPYSMEIFKDLGFEEVLRENFIQKNGAEFIDFRNGDRIKFDFANSGKAKFPFAYEVIRSKMDKLFLDHAKNKFGVKVFQPAKITSIVENKDSIDVSLDDGVYLSASFLVDASGRSSYFGSKHTTKNNLESFNDLACYAHFKGLPRFQDPDEGNITIGVIGEGAWLWSIPFKGDVTSLGVVCSRKTFKDVEEGRDLILYFKEKFPKLKAYLSGAKQVSELGFASNYSFSRDQYFGKRWVLVGDSMGFLDPVFSTGVHIALYSGKLSASAIDYCLKKGAFLSEDVGETYQNEIQLGYKRFSNLLGLFYGPNFLTHMKKTLRRDIVRMSFTELIAGGAWEHDNILYRMNVI